MQAKLSSGKRDTLVLLLVGLAVTIAHILANGQYGFHRDELDIILNSQNLAWGYVAYPPLTPFLARLEFELFGLSLTGMRIFPALSQGLCFLLVAWMARDLGGRLGAQVLAGLVAVAAPIAIIDGTLMQYMTFDYLWWVLLAFSVVRLIRTENPRWWLAIGAAIGLGMMTKYTMGVFVLAMVVGVLITPLRRYLRSGWLWAGAGLALLIFLPNLIWQIQHDFISLQFLSEIHARDLEWGRGEGFIAGQFYQTNQVFALPLWIAGLYFYLISKEGRPFRALGWMYLLPLAFFLVTQGRSYYPAPTYPMLIAAGTIWFDERIRRLSVPRARAARGAEWGLLALGGLAFFVALKPIAPIQSPLFQLTAGLTDVQAEMIGWPDLVDQVSAVVDELSPAEREQTVIMTGNYGEAGALMLLAEERSLPPVISGGNSLWERGYALENPQTVLFVGFEPDFFEGNFDECEARGQVSNQYGVRNEESTMHTTLYLCRGPRFSWPEVWPEVRWFQ